MHFAGVDRPACGAGLYAGRAPQTNISCVTGHLQLSAQGAHVAQRYLAGPQHRSQRRGHGESTGLGADLGEYIGRSQLGGLLLHLSARLRSPSQLLAQLPIPRWSTRTTRRRWWPLLKTPMESPHRAGAGVCVHDSDHDSRGLQWHRHAALRPARLDHSGMPAAGLQPSSYNQIGLFGNGSASDFQFGEYLHSGNKQHVLYMASTQSEDVVQVDLRRRSWGRRTSCPMCRNSHGHQQ